MQAAAVVDQVQLLARAVLGVVVLVVLAVLVVLLGLLTQAEAAAEAVMLAVLDPQAVVALSSFAIQTHSNLQRLQLVHQR